MAVGIVTAHHEAILVHRNVSPACHCACIRAACQAALGAAVQRADGGPCRAAATPNLRAVELGAAEGKIKGAAPWCAPSQSARGVGAAHAEYGTVPSDCVNPAAM